MSAEDEDSELHKAHADFAYEVVEDLLINYELKGHDERKSVYSSPDIVDAIIFLYNTFREDFEKILSHVHTTIRDEDLFKEYCELIPVYKDNCFFYHYLKRISLIFKMAMFCYENSRKKHLRHFQAGRSCIGDFSDVKYFESAGGWTELDRTASFLVRIALPQKLLLRYWNEESDLTYVDFVKQLRSRFTHSGNIKMLDSEELKCLEELKDLFENQVASATSNEILGATQLCIVDMQELLESGKQVLSKYIEDCFSHENEPIASLEEENKYLMEKSPSEMEADRISAECSERNIVEDNLSFKTNEDAPEDYKGEYTCDKPSTSCTTSFSPDKLTKEEGQAGYTSFSDLCTIPRKSKSDVKNGASSRSVPSEISKSDSLQNFDTNAEEKESKLKQNFIVPKAYMDCFNEENLYVAKMDPPSKREKLDESQKSIIDSNINDKNYKQLPNGDIFVCSDSTDEREILVIFVDSSSDQQIEEDTYKLICQFKKADIKYEHRSLNLRSRKYEKSTSPTKKAKTKHDRSVSIESSKSTIKKASSFTDYTKYITCLYKRCLPAILNEKLKLFKKSPTKSSPNKTFKVKEQSDLIFVVDASLLAKRKTQLFHSLKKTSLRYLLFYTFELVELDGTEWEKIFDSYVRNRLFHSINVDHSVYIVGSKSLDNAEFTEMSCLALFPGASEKPTNTELIKILISYETSILARFQLPDGNYFEHVIAQYIDIFME